MATKPFSQDFELWVANYYKAKIDHCKSKGIEFNLNLISVRNLLAAKTCGYSGMKLTVPRGKGLPLLATDVTIDRIDSSLPYQKGNVIACSNSINNFKSLFECSNYHIDMNMAVKSICKMQKKIKQVKEKE